MHQFIRIILKRIIRGEKSQIFIGQFGVTCVKIDFWKGYQSVEMSLRGAKEKIRNLRMITYFLSVAHYP